jgi:hypothetical protein
MSELRKRMIQDMQLRESRRPFEICAGARRPDSAHDEHIRSMLSFLVST